MKTIHRRNDFDARRPGPPDLKDGCCPRERRDLGQDLVPSKSPIARPGARRRSPSRHADSSCCDAAESSLNSDHARGRDEIVSGGGQDGPVEVDDRGIWKGEQLGLEPLQKVLDP